MKGKFDRFFDILLILVEYLHVLEQIYLLTYLFKFLKEYKLRWNKRDLQNKITFFVSKSKKSYSRAAFFKIITTLFMVTAIAIPPIEFLRTYNYKHTFLDERCGRYVGMLNLSVTYANHGMSLFTNLITVLVCLLMIFFTIVIGAIWKWSDDDESPCRPVNDSDQKADTLPKNSSSGENSTNISRNALYEDLKMVCKKRKESLDKYTVKTEMVKPIYKIFRSFFVIHWIIQVFSLSFHIAKAVRPWIKYGQIADTDDELMVINQVLFIIFDGLALVITYTCALKMNAYLRRYVRKLQADQLKFADSVQCHGLTHLFLIKVESVSKSAFAPRIPGTGFNVSINNPGFVLGILFCVFGLIGSQLAF